jgi:protein phosphatase
VQGYNVARFRLRANVSLSNTLFKVDTNIGVEESCAIVAAMQIQTGQYTDKGPRANNQDSVRVNAALAYAAIADGMGGAAGGAEASRMAIELVDWLLLKELPEARRTQTVPQLLTRLFDDANRWIYEKNLSTRELRGMGTTLVVLIITDSRCHVAHAGDSRAYLLRGSDLLQLTKDHSLVQTRIDAGLIRPEEALQQPDRNVITRAVGVGPQLDADVSDHEILGGDTFVLTTDGVHGVVPADRIRALAAGPTQEVAENLVAEALRLRTTDNSTAAVIRALGRPPAATPDTSGGETLLRPPSLLQRLLGR